MTDKGKIFQEVLERNDLRRRALLPSLNVREEYEFAVAEAEYKDAYAEYRRAYDSVAVIYEERVWSKLAQHGRVQRHGLGGWGNRIYVKRVLDRITRMQTGEIPPKQISPKHLVVYGSGS